MKKLLFLISLPLFAVQSVQITSACDFNSLTNCPYNTLPNSTPFTTLGRSDFRVELRLHNFTTPAPIDLGPFAITTNSGIVLLNPNGGADTIVPTGASNIQISPHSDVLIRLQRKNIAQQWTFTLCDTNGLG
ncbi:MAG TPA: hypothetical protein VNX68_08105, partial [Nitrosopumilaceae archaeon]|nr:hypothetical protein [Nitrosopumilaceae archaeon]